MRPEGDAQISLEFMMGLSRAKEDVEVRRALRQLDDPIGVLLERFGAATSAESAHRSIAACDS